MPENNGITIDAAPSSPHPTYQNNYMSSPSVSVLMSVYNGETYLAEAIESILTQSFSDFEFIIINDGSTDRSSDILRKYADNDQRIIIIEHNNIGLTKSLNTGIKKARGTYIARMDADDISEKRRFETQVNILKNHPEIGVIGTSAKIIDENGNVKRVCNQIEPHNKIITKILSDNKFIHGSIMIRKSILDVAGPYNESYIYAQDYELILRLSNFCKIANTSQKLYRWRENYISGISVVKRRIQINYRDLARDSFMRNTSQSSDTKKIIALNWLNNPKDQILSAHLKRITDDLSTPNKLILKNTLKMALIIKKANSSIKKLCSHEN